MEVLELYETSDYGKWYNYYDSHLISLNRLRWIADYDFSARANIRLLGHLYASQRGR